ncbi:TniQ family protein [Aquitalea aquatica]
MLWPAHPHPFRDELLSSWLVRVAHANGLKVQTFCDHEFGSERQLWNRDIDRLAPTWLVETMSEKTGTPLKCAMATTLLTYEGKLYNKYHPSGQLRWILPLQIYHRKRRGHGLQFCPQCLDEDTEPYYRKAWRVGLYTFCPKHNVMLLDRCPRCGYGVAFHRLELGRPSVVKAPSLASCWYCDFDLRTAPAPPISEWDECTFQHWNEALQCIENNSTFTTHFDYSTLTVLHHFCTLLVSMRLAPKLHAYLCDQTGQPFQLLVKNRTAFELRTQEERHYVSGLAWWLLGQWPNRLMAAWLSKAIRYNTLLKDFGDPPTWYLTVSDEIGAMTWTKLSSKKRHTMLPN